MAEAHAPNTRLRSRIAIAAAVLAGHVLLVIALVAAFAPDFGRQVVAAGLEAVDITSPPPPPPPPKPEHRATIIAPRTRTPASSAPRADAAPIEAPIPVIPLAMPTFAAPVAGNGAGLAPGQGGAGHGDGAGGSGNGVGGAGSGGGHAGDPVKIGGGIDLVRDYPAATRDQRIGDYVVIEIAVGADGMPGGCTVTRPSRDVAANALTCKLAVSRFRFRPATDAGGRAVAGTYGWKQVWRK